MTTIFALWSGIGDGLAALVIVQSEIFAEASRQLVRYVVAVLSWHGFPDVGAGSSRNSSSISTASNVLRNILTFRRKHRR